MLPRILNYSAALLTLIPLVTANTQTIFNVVRTDCAHMCDGGRLCLSASWLCDGEADCADGSDEVGCICTERQFRCQREGRCIKQVRN